MHRIRRAFPLTWALSLTFLACGEEEPRPAPDATANASDAGFASDAAVGPDAAEPDSGPPDSGVPIDSGVVLNASSCLECTTNEECSAVTPGVCLRNQMGERFCGERCDAHLDGCIGGFSCVNIAADGEPAFFVCVPPAGTCRGPGLGFGSPCNGGVAQCQAERGACQADHLAVGYCTDPCFGAGAGCPAGYRCGDGDDGTTVCRAEFAAGAERCGQEGRLEEILCNVNADCTAAGAPGGICAGAQAGLPGVCGPECNAARECGAGFVCRLGPDDREVCLPARCECRGHTANIPDGTRDLLREALDLAGVDRCRVTWSVHDWAGTPNDMLADPYRIAFFDAVHNEPLHAPGWATGAVGRLEDGATMGGPAARAAALVTELAAIADRPVERLPPDRVDPIQPLATAAAAFIRAAGGTPDEAALRADAADVPPDLQLAVASVIDGARRALLGRRAAFNGLNAQTVTRLFEAGAGEIAYRADGAVLNAAAAGVAQQLNTTIRYGALYGGAVDALEAIDFADLAPLAVPAPAGTATVATATATLIFNQVTPAGRIAIGGADSGIYDERRAGFGGPWAVLVDVGGHDTYRISAGGNASATNPVSIAIDLTGRDRYGYVEVPHALDGRRLVSDAGGRYRPRTVPEETLGPISLSDVARQGGARAGVALLVDLGTDDDHYQSLRMSQGVGVFGTGVLIDEGGDDVYLAENLAQGAAVFGIGALLDIAGDDVYRAYHASQGFAYARAAGLLYDVNGHDRYLVDVGDPTAGGDPLYGSPQRQGRANSSLSQGFAFGRRADFSDRAFMSGGVAFLIDGAGDDQYEASIFAQGGGYWFGTGVLADKSGNDRYDGLWYAMGAGAHYALGFLLEGGGNDVYGGRLERLNVTIGGGHDYTAAFFIDESGDDQYNGSRITLGSGNTNGMGFFVDNAGDDTYRAKSGYSAGAAGLLEAGPADPGNSRRKVKTIGLFIDAAGTDTFMQDGMMTMPADLGDNRTWRRPQTPMTDEAKRAAEKSAGVDGSGESTLRAIW